MGSNEIEEIDKIWSDNTKTLGEINIEMVFTSWGLGLIDRKLRYDLDQIVDRLEKCEHRGPGFLLEYPELSGKLLEFSTLSYLWVLGMYEIVRAIDERVKKSEIIKEDKIIKEIHKTKILFERVRIPLAKYEPARRFEKTDLANIPMLFPERDKGVAWLINENVVINRHQLADAYLNLLQLLSSYFKKTN